MLVFWLLFRKRGVWFKVRLVVWFDRGRMKVFVIKCVRSFCGLWIGIVVFFFFLGYGNWKIDCSWILVVLVGL